MSFLTIIPRDKLYLQYTLKEIPLKIIRTNGVEVIPDVKINISDLNEGKKYYLNNSSKVNTFKASVIINKNDKIEGVKSEVYESFSVLELLDYWMRNMTVLMITTEAIDIKDGNYIISKNSSRKQEYTDYTVWNLEFTSYEGVQTGKLQLNTSKAQSAKKAYEKIKTNNRNNNALKKCNVKYMKLGKTNGCCYYLNYKLALKGFIKSTDWNKMQKNKTHKKFSKTTATALKKFQKKYAKKYKLKKNGKMDKATLKALVSI